MNELAVGATFSEHLIRGVAGRGGMGIVYRALHVPLKREVALKVMSPEMSVDHESRARFQIKANRRRDCDDVHKRNRE